MLVTLSSPSPTVQDISSDISSTAMCQSLNIRYELSDHTLDSALGNASDNASLPTHSLLSLYWEGRRLGGYRTIEQFYDDMATEGWQIQSISRAHSCRQLHFAVMTREL